MNRALEIVPRSDFRPPRGPVVDAAWIVRHYHTDPDSGKPTRTEKWVRQTVPNKMRLGHSTVGWFQDDVVDYYEKMRRAS